MLQYFKTHWSNWFTAFYSRSKLEKKLEHRVHILTIKIEQCRRTMKENSAIQCSRDGMPNQTSPTGENHTGGSPTGGNHTGGIEEILNAERKFLLRNNVFSWGMMTLLLFLLPLVAIALCDSWFLFREHMAFFLASLAIFSSVIGGILLAIRYRKEKPSIRSIATILEKHYPEFMDSLICSVELLQKPSHSPLVKPLLRHTEHQLQQKDVHAAVKSLVMSTQKRILLLAMLVGGFAFLYLSPFTNKVYCYAGEIFGSAAGLKVIPGTIEVAGGDDLTIEAIILRGPKQATIIIDDTIRYDMYETSGKNLSFELFGIGENFSYVIVTPRLKSATYQVTTYRKPEIKQITVEITPPAYTRRSPTKINTLQNMIVPQGSQVSFLLESTIPADIQFHAIKEGEPEKVFSFASTSPATYRYDLLVSSSLRFSLALIDSKNRIAKGNSYTIESLPDLPPIIQPITPDDDAVRAPEEEIVFSAKVIDDYGIASIDIFMVTNGGESEEQHTLYRSKNAEASPEEIVAYSLALKGKVNVGDVISYYYKAVDNASPEANVIFSDVRFLEIRPKKEDMEQQMDMPGGKMKQLSIADLIIDQKRLIRDTWRVKGIKSQERKKEVIGDLATAASALRTTSAKRLASLKGDENKQQQTATESPPAPTDNTQNNSLVSQLFRQAVSDANPQRKAKNPLLGQIGELFEEAIDYMESAEKLLTKYLPEESFPYQQKSLSNLISMEIELEKNMLMAKKGKGEEGKSKPSKNVDEENQEKKKQKEIESLEDALSSLEKLIKKQNSLTRTLVTSSLGKNAQEDIQRKQKHLMAETEKLEKNVRSLPGSPEVVKELQEAMKNMENVASKVKVGQGGTAKKYGKRASQFLQRAHHILQTLQDNAVANQLQRIEKMMEGMTQEQQGIMQETAGLSGPGKSSESKSLSARQKNNKKRLEKMMKMLEKTSRALEKSSPSVSQGIKETSDIARQERIAENMKRSKNALRYQKFGRAKDYQQQIMASLEQLKEHFQGVMREQQSTSAENLARMLQSVIQAMEQVKILKKENGSPEEKQENYRNIQAQLQEISTQLKDDSLARISQELKNITLGKTSSSGTDAQVLSLLYQSAQVLERRLTETVLENKISISQASGQKAPDEYKKLVKEYFKNLSIQTNTTSGIN